ncbi:MAG: M20/M25/M40 family metallo-hydrolase [Bacteroidota bacterium]
MKRFFARVFRLVSLAILVLIGIMIINWIRFSSEQVEVESVQLAPVSDQVTERLSKIIQISTQSSSRRVDTTDFRRLDTVLWTQFSKVFQELDTVRIGCCSWLLFWPGTNPNLEPILLSSHIDVVSVDEASITEWEQGPWSGAEADGFIWGRGTLDDKSSGVAILESLTRLIELGYRPGRGVYFTMGHDEESSGVKGAKEIARYLEKEGVRLAYVIDEGLVVLNQALEGLEPPLAMVGIAEKGMTDLTLTYLDQQGGHTMMPPTETAVSALGAALGKLQNHPFEASLDGVVAEFFDFIGPEFGRVRQLLFANRWITAPLIISSLEQDRAANALIRTTIAPTMIQGGIRSNVLPAKASAKVNVRIKPGETIESVKEWVREMIDDDRIIVEADASDWASNPSPISPTDAFGFEVIEKTIREIMPETIVAPSLVIAATDARHYVNLTDQIYRFMPIRIDKSELSRIHGLNERISVDNYKQMIQFYEQLIRNSCQ